MGILFEYKDARLFKEDAIKLSVCCSVPPCKALKPPIHTSPKSLNSSAKKFTQNSQSLLFSLISFLKLSFVFFSWTKGNIGHASLPNENSELQSTCSILRLQNDDFTKCISKHRRDHSIKYKGAILRKSFRVKFEFESSKVSQLVDSPYDILTLPSISPRSPFCSFYNV